MTNDMFTGAEVADMVGRVPAVANGSYQYIVMDHEVEAPGSMAVQPAGERVAVGMDGNIIDRGGKDGVVEEVQGEPTTIGITQVEELCRINSDDAGAKVGGSRHQGGIAGMAFWITLCAGRFGKNVAHHGLWTFAAGAEQQGQDPRRKQGVRKAAMPMQGGCATFVAGFPPCRGLGEHLVVASCSHHSTSA